MGKHFDAGYWETLQRYGYHIPRELAPIAAINTRRDDSHRVTLVIPASSGSDMVREAMHRSLAPVMGNH